MRCLSDEARIPANPGARGEQVAVARDDLGSKRRKPDGAAGRDVAARPVAACRKGSVPVYRPCAARIGRSRGDRDPLDLDQPPRGELAGRAQHRLLRRASVLRRVDLQTEESLGGRGVQEQPALGLSETHAAQSIAYFPTGARCLFCGLPHNGLMLAAARLVT